MGLLAVVLVCSSLVGARAEISVNQALLTARDQPVDLLITAGPDLATPLDGHPHLAPDAWMTPGLVSEEQIRQVQVVPGVEVVAPATVLPTWAKPAGEAVSAWLPSQPGAYLAWTADLQAATTDGTGTRRTDLQQVGALLQADTTLVSPGISRASLLGPTASPVVVLGPEGYRYEPQYAPATGAGLLANTYLTAARSFAVAVDPEAEARLARAVGAEDLASSLDTLAQTSTAADAGTQEAAMARLSPPLTNGQPVPALVSTEPRGEITVEATITARTPADLGPQAQAPDGGCQTSRLLKGCHSLSPEGLTALHSLPVTEIRSSSLSSPLSAWAGHAHPYTTDAASPVPVISTGPFWAHPDAASAKVLAPLSRTDSSGSSGPGVVLSPVGPPSSLGSQWHDETYRPHTQRPTPVPALSLLAGEADTYTPVTSTFQAGTSPLSASTLRTADGPVRQTLDATGAATSAAPALVSRQLLQALMPGGELGAGVLRVRLERPTGQPPSDTELERVAAQIAQTGLDVTVLTGASPVEVGVTLGGHDPVAWHGTATETWTELGAVLRVERATGWALRLLPVLAVLVVGALTVLVESNASVARRQEARTLLHTGWTGQQVRRRLLAATLPGSTLVGVACLLVVLLALIRPVASAGPGTGALVVVGLAACLGTIALAWWDGWRAAQPRRIAPPTPTGGRASWRRLGLRRARRRGGGASGSPLAVGWHAHNPGRWAVSGAALAAGALTVLGLEVLSATSSQAGFSELAAQGTGLVGAAARLLLLLAACATAAVLLLGLGDLRRAAHRRQRLLASLGWSRRSRLGAEAALWARQLAPVLLVLLPTTALGLGGPTGWWQSGGPAGTVSALLWGCLVAACVLLVAVGVTVRTALRAAQPVSLPAPAGSAPAGSPARAAASVPPV